MIVKYPLILQRLKAVNVVVKYRLKLLDVVGVHFEVHESVAERGVAVGELNVVSSLFK